MLHIRALKHIAALPTRGSPFSAGVDVAAAEKTMIPAGGAAEIKTGFSVAVPAGTYARLAPRSGLAAKRMIDVGAGVVNADDTDEVSVLLFNHGTEDFSVDVGDRVAQLIVEEVATPSCELQEVDSLDATARGQGGFGSTGVAGAVPADAEPAAEQAPAASNSTPLGEKTLLVKKLHAGAKLPERSSRQAAGFTVAASEAAVVPAHGKAIVKTGLSMAAPQGTYARVAPLRQLAVEKMLHWGAGVVDSDYRGEVGVVLFNFGDSDAVIDAGEPIAQLVLQSICLCDCAEVKELSATQRGVGGFGSTGVQQKSQVRSDEQTVQKNLTEEATAAPALLMQRLAPEAVLPKRGSVEAAGLDLAAAAAATVPARGKAIVKTGWAIATPPGTYARIAPRSGLAAKKMIHCGAGVVDEDYRGEVGVVLFNHGSEPFEVAIGDRVAQLILERAQLLDISSQRVRPLEVDEGPAAKRQSTEDKTASRTVATPSRARDP